MYPHSTSYPLTTTFNTTSLVTTTTATGVANPAGAAYGQPTYPTLRSRSLGYGHGNPPPAEDKEELHVGNAIDRLCHSSLASKVNFFYGTSINFIVKEIASLPYTHGDDPRFFAAVVEKLSAAIRKYGKLVEELDALGKDIVATMAEANNQKDSELLWRLASVLKTMGERILDNDPTRKVSDLQNTLAAVLIDLDQRLWPTLHSEPVYTVPFSPAFELPTPAAPSANASALAHAVSQSAATAVTTSTTTTAGTNSSTPRAAAALPRKPRTLASGTEDADPTVEGREYDHFCSESLGRAVYLTHQRTFFSISAKISFRPYSSYDDPVFIQGLIDSLKRDLSPDFIENLTKLAKDIQEHLDSAQHRANAETILSVTATLLSMCKTLQEGDDVPVDKYKTRVSSLLQRLEAWAWPAAQADAGASAEKDKLVGKGGAKKAKKAEKAEKAEKEKKAKKEKKASAKPGKEKKSAIKKAKRASMEFKAKLFGGKEKSKAPENTSNSSAGHDYFGDTSSESKDDFVDSWDQ